MNKDTNPCARCQRDLAKESQRQATICLGENDFLGARCRHEQVDRPPLAKRMRLRPQPRIIVAQTVGYPKAGG